MENVHQTLVPYDFYEEDSIPLQPFNFNLMKSFFRGFRSILRVTPWLNNEIPSRNLKGQGLKLITTTSVFLSCSRYLL